MGHITLVDHDDVELSSLLWQQFAYSDVGQDKALALAHRLKEQVTGRSLIEAYGLSFQDALKCDLEPGSDIAVIVADNNPIGVASSPYYQQHAISAISLAGDSSATHRCVFVQSARRDDLCFECLFPKQAGTKTCMAVPGHLSRFQVVAGIALYAIDSLLMPRTRPWNYKNVYLGMASDGHNSPWRPTRLVLHVQIANAMGAICATAKR